MRAVFRFHVICGREAGFPDLFQHSCRTRVYLGTYQPPLPPDVIFFYPKIRAYCVRIPLTKISINDGKRPISTSRIIRTISRILRIRTS